MCADELLEALHTAATNGDAEAILFLPIFAQWLSRASGASHGYTASQRDLFRVS